MFFSSGFSTFYAFRRVANTFGRVRTRSDAFGRVRIAARQWPDSCPTVARHPRIVARQWPDSGPTVARHHRVRYASLRVRTRSDASFCVITRHYA